MPFARLAQALRFERAIRRVTEEILDRPLADFEEELTLPALRRLRQLERNLVALALSMAVYDANQSVIAAIAHHESGDDKSAGDEIQAMAMRITGGWAFKHVAGLRVYGDFWGRLAPLGLGFDDSLTGWIFERPLDFAAGRAWLTRHRADSEAFSAYVIRRNRWLEAIRDPRA